MHHTILFTGHMIDSPDRKEPRFPQKKESSVKMVLEKHLTDLLFRLSAFDVTVKGIAGGACGGDILFHELCKKLNIETEVYLPLPVEAFKKNSVAFAGKTWERRFEKLIKEHKVHILLGEKKNIWEEANVWMLEESFKHGPKKSTLLALWDLKTGDGEGGTKHMIITAKEKGANVIVIDITKL